MNLSEHKVLTYNYDLLRNAIALGATKVVEYLAVTRVLAHSIQTMQQLKATTFRST